MAKKYSLRKLILDLEGTSLSREELNFLSNPYLAGIILFSRNIESRSQVQKLCGEIRSVNPDLLIAVDQEGGRVQRLKDGFTKIPSMHEISEYCSQNNFSKINIVQEIGWLMASEVLAAGLDISFAPVLDLDLKTSSIIGHRSFGDSPELVIKMADLFINGMNEAGMQAVGKHFPGHGGIFEDSHIQNVKDCRKFEELEKHDLLPFQILKEKLGGIMTAHILFPSIDSNIVTFSKYWISEILRKKINFQGIIFSDDLSMKGTKAEGNISQKIQKAFQAGCNILLVCNDRSAALEGLKYLEEKEGETFGNLRSLQANQNISWESLESNPRRVKTQSAIDDILNYTK